MEAQTQNCPFRNKARCIEDLARPIRKAGKDLQLGHTPEQAREFFMDHKADLENIYHRLDHEPGRGTEKDTIRGLLREGRELMAGRSQANYPGQVANQLWDVMESVNGAKLEQDRAKYATNDGPSI